MSSFSREIYGIPCMDLSIGPDQASVAAQGAQVLSWIDSHGRERLYLSPQTLSLDPAQGEKHFGAAIRGGIPICFPQFSDRGPLMKHGFVRNRLWSLENHAALSDDGTGARSVLRFSDDQATLEKWPQSFAAEADISLHPGQLRIRLRIRNTGTSPFSFTAALHTYLRVQDVRRAYLFGLEGMAFQDATKGNLHTVQHDAQLRIEDKIDRVYLTPPEELVLYESGQPSLRIAQHGFTDTVVWNPGPAKAAALTDFPDGDWLRMLCIEAACAVKPIALPPDESWTGVQILSIP